MKKRDGRRVPLDLGKLTDSIAAAARAAGEEARVPAEEIAEIAILFLEKHLQDRIPDTREIENLVEKALLETNHARTAAVYAERLKARARTRDEIRVHRDGAPVAPDGEPLPAPPGEPWSEGRIVAALERRRIEPALAEEIAASVEQRVFAVGLKHIPASLVREIVNAELADRGFSARLGRPAEVSIPVEEVRRILVSSYVRRGTGAMSAAPGWPEAAVGQDVLARFALAEVFPPPIAEAHLEGTIHIQDLGRPLRLTSAAISLEALKTRPATRKEGPRSAGELGLVLARLCGALITTHARAIGIPYANVFLAPFTRGKEATALRALRELVRLLPSTDERPLVRFHVAPVPPALASVPVLGPRGRRWKIGYGDLAAEADRAARLLLTAVREESAARGELSAGLPGVPGPIGVVVGLGERPAFDLLEGAAGATLEAEDLEPARSRGLASADALVPKADLRRRPIAAGAASVVAVNCARAAYRAGPADEPALRREIFAAIERALSALAAKWAFLEAALYRPKLPLWEAARTEGPFERAAVDPADAVQSLALIGLDEALAYALGEPPAANGAVARLAAELCRDVAAHAREEGARRGLSVRLEEPELERASRRIADLDLTRFTQAGEILKLSGNGSPGGDLAYGTGFGGAVLDPLSRAIGVAPFLDGPDLAARARRILGLAPQGAIR